MARPGHFGDSAGSWNETNKQLYKILGMGIPVEAIRKIRQVRGSRNGIQGNTEQKKECKILLCILEGKDWRSFNIWNIDHKISYADGGTDSWDNLRLVLATENARKGARSIYA